MNTCTNIKFTDTIWNISIECTPADQLLPFSTIPVDFGIQHLIISFCLYEPQINDDKTEWTKNTINFIHQNNIFPNLKNIYILTSSVYIDYSQLPDHYMVFGHQPRYFLLRSDDTENKSVGVDYTISWQSTLNNRKALWLIGDTTGRVHKFPLLYKFYQSQTLNYLEYSLTNKLNDSHMGDQFREEIVVQYYERVIQATNDVFDLQLDYNEFKILYESLCRELPGDEIFEQYIKENRHSFDIASYVFPTEWNDASLIVMPETWFDHPAWKIRPYAEYNTYPLTEKTWKPIATKKPFIGISRCDLQEQTLESLGFKTFRKYTNRPKLYYEPNIELKTYIDVAHDRIVSFLDNSLNYAPGITEDIEYNYYHYKMILKEEWNMLYRCCPPLKYIDKRKVIRLFTCPPPVSIMNYSETDLIFNTWC